MTRVEDVETLRERGVVVDGSGRRGTVDRVERDGTCHVWFGVLREVDGARETEPLRCESLSLEG